MPFGPSLHGRVREPATTPVERVDQQPHVDELVREQNAVVGIGESRAQLERAGRGVDLVVEVRQRAGRELLDVGAVEGRHLQLRAGVETRG